MTRSSMLACGVLCLAAAFGEEPPVAADSPVETGIRTSLWVDGKEVTISVDKTGKTLVVQGKTLISFPGKVTELRAGLWYGGYALAIETRSNDTKGDGFEYWWFTSHCREATRFLETATDYDLGGVVNSTGDSIYILLTHHDRGGKEETVSGYAYVHNCPIPAAAGMKGKLYVLGSQPAPEVEKKVQEKAEK